MAGRHRQAFFAPAGNLVGDTALQVYVRCGAADD
jgi:hypothetical protein